MGLQREWEREREEGFGGTGGKDQSRMTKVASCCILCLLSCKAIGHLHSKKNIVVYEAMYHLVHYECPAKEESYGCLG